MSKARLAVAISLVLGMAVAGDSVAEGAHTNGNPWHVDKQAYIVQAATAGLAGEDVAQVGGQVSRDLGIIRAVEATLTEGQAVRLKKMATVHVYKDRSLGTEGLALTTALGKTVTSTLNVVTTGSAATSDGQAVSTPTLLYQANYPALVGADSLQNQGITGKGVTVAILDTGLYQDPLQNFGPRVLASVDLLNGSKPVTSDPYGHGTHITSIAAGGAANAYGNWLSIAPQANLVIVRAFDGQGAAKYSDVIAGLNWIIANQAKYKIRVVNLSFGAPPESYYWDDPLNQAVMQAWRAGVVVVAAAGNEGPDPMTIGVPGNVPYVITTGALTDNGTPYNASDDKLASFSSTGPTFEGFVKPEVVAPGGHMVGSMPSKSYLANIDPHSMNPTQQLFTMSGTSQAAAVTTGVVALMLQVNPACRPTR